MSHDNQKILENFCLCHWLTLFTQDHISSYLLQSKNCPQFLLSLALPRAKNAFLGNLLQAVELCTLPVLNSLMDLFTRRICIKSSKVVDGVGGRYLYFFCMLLQILSHLSSFYCFEDPQLASSQIYYCTIFSSTEILDSGL